MSFKSTLFVIYLLTITSFADASIRLFEVIYDISINGLDSAQETRKLSKENDVYTLVAQAKTIGFADIAFPHIFRFYSRFAIEDNKLVTQEYKVLKKSGNKVIENTKLTIVDDKDDLIVNQNGFAKHYPYTGKHPLTDILSISIALSIDVSLTQSKDKFHYQVLQKDELSTYDFTNHGREIVKINGHRISSIKLVRPDKERELYVWLDPKQHYVPIIMEQIENKLRYRYTLNKINFQ